jgi:hypothetical protein
MIVFSLAWILLDAINKNHQGVERTKTYFSPSRRLLLSRLFSGSDVPRRDSLDSIVDSLTPPDDDGPTDDENSTMAPEVGESNLAQTVLMAPTLVKRRDGFKVVRCASLESNQ